MLRIAWFGEKIDQKNILKLFTPQPEFFFLKKKRKMLRISWFGEKIGRKNILKILLPPDLKKKTENEKGLQLPDFARKLIREYFEIFLPSPPDFFFEKKTKSA